MPTLTAMTWFYRLFGEEFGPVPHEMLVALLENGTLSASDEVRAENGTHWLPIQEVLNAPEDQTLASAGQATLEGLGDTQNGWYCKVLGRELGPMGFDEIQSFVEEGQLGAEAEVKLGSGGKWRTVRSIGRLMAVLPFQKGEHKIPEGRSSREFDIPSQVSAAKPVDAPRPSSSRSRISDEFDDDDDVDEEERRPRRKKKRRRSSDAQGYAGGTPPFGMPAFFPGAPGAGFGGYPPAATPGYGMPAMGGAYGNQWGQPAVPAPVDHLWYAWIGGQEYGPIEYSQLTQWAAAGQLASSDYVKQGQTSQYVLASTIAGLMPPAASAKPEVQAPAVVTPTVSTPAVVTPVAAVKAAEASASTATARASDSASSATAKSSDTQATSALDTAKLSRSGELATVAEVKPAAELETSRPAASSSYSSGASSYGSSGGGYGSSSGFGGAPAPSRAMPPRPMPKKKAAAERPEWLDDAIEAVKSPKGLVAAGLIALVGLYFCMGFLPASTGSDRALQAKLENVLISVKKLREAKAPAPEWEALAQSAKKDYPKDFIDKLQQSASRKYPYKQLHLWCVRDRLDKMIANSRTKVSHEERDFENNLREAAKLLGMPSTIAAAPEVAASTEKPASGAQ